MATHANVMKSAQLTASQPVTRLLALGAIAGPVVFTLGWFVLGFISPGYTRLHKAI